MSVIDRSERRSGLDKMLPKVSATAAYSGILGNIRRHRYHLFHSLLENRVKINTRFLSILS